MENARRFSIAQCSLPYKVFLSCCLFSSASCWTGFRFASAVITIFNPILSSSSSSYSFNNIMIAPLSILLLAAAASISASPAFTSRAVQKLNEAAFDEAQQRDGTATRAFSNTAIKVRVVINSRHRRLISLSRRLPTASVSQ